MNTLVRNTLIILALMTDCFNNIASAELGDDPNHKKSDTFFRYMRTDIPPFADIQWTGETYVDLVPDTYDLAERAKLAVQAMTNMVDSQRDYETYFRTILYNNPPVHVHSLSDICFVKLYEAVPLLRLISGSKKNLNVDHAWKQNFLKSIGPDGLYYFDTQSRPWLMEGKDLYWTHSVSWPDGKIEPPGNRKFDFITESVIMGRSLAFLTLYNLQDQNPVWDEIAKKNISRFSELIIDTGDYAFLPARRFVPGSKVPSDADMPVGVWAEELGGRLIQGLTEHYRITGFEPAQAMAQKLATYLRYHGLLYDKDGRFIYPDIDGKYKVGGHFHTHTFGLVSLADYALCTNDREMMEFVRKSYEWAKSQNYCSALLGWFPEIATDKDPTSELCCIADMITIGLMLSESGVQDCWDDVDRWTRNYFAEGQFTQIDWIKQQSPRFPTNSGAGYTYRTDQNVPENCLGAFSAYVTGNDYGITDGAPTGVAGCCMGNAARAIYYIWDRCLKYDNGRLTVNLLLNHASKWADVHSHIPYKGQVDIKLKQPCETVLIRIPEWINNIGEEVRCEVDATPRAFTSKGRYVYITDVKKGQNLSVYFPISERTISDIRIGDANYTFVLKGNTIVNVDPPGKYYPLFLRRDHYRTNSTRWVNRERFVADRQIHW